MDFKQFYKTINFDIDNEIRTVYQATQGDTKSRGLIVDLIVGGVKTPVTTETMNFFALKPDGTRVMTVGVKEGTGFRIDFTNQTFAVPGTLLCALVLYGTNGEKIADKKFKMTVDSSLEDGAIISKDERGILDRAFDLANGIVPQLEDIETRFQTLTAEQQQDAEVIDARQGALSLGANITEIKSQLAENTQDLDTFRMNGYFIPFEKIQVPKEIGFSVLIEIKKNGVGVFETNIEPEHLYPENPTLKTYYVDFKNGNNDNDGLTLATAFKNFSKARDMSDVGTIMVAEGWYDKDQHTFPVDKSIKVKAIEGHKVVFSAHSPVTFSLHSGNTYKTTRSATIGVWDKKNVDDYGEYIRMAKLTNIVDVENTPNSWYFDSATNTVYVHCFDGRSPDENVMVSVNTQSANMSGDNTYYVEGIQFCFGRGVYFQTLDGVAQPTLLAKDCKFSYSDLENGLNVNGAKLVVLKNCESSNNYKDGFNYHDKNGATGEAIEIGCVGRKNGADGEGINNGSSAHDNYKVIRVGGWYTENEGPNVADVGNTYSLNIGCTATNTTATMGNQADFLTEFKMWLDNCCANGSLHSVQSGSVSSDIKVRNSMLYGQIAEGTGTY